VESVQSVIHTLTQFCGIFRASTSCGLLAVMLDDAEYKRGTIGALIS
jgi:hypothetical protein